MVSRFRRTHSFPIPPSPLENKSTYHIRSTSLPTCRSHPLITQLKDEIIQLKIWESNPSDLTSAWLCKGLVMLRNIHDSFEDLLHLTQIQESLVRHRSDWFEKLLEDYLNFVDVYGIFRAAIVEIKEDQLQVQMAIRRKDESKIDSYVKSRKKMEKEMKKLVSSVRSIPIQESDSPVFESECDRELDLILKDLNEVTVFVTVCMIKGISISSMNSNSWMKLWKKKKEKKEEGIRELREVVGVLENRSDEERRRVLRNLEECIGEIENGCEKVFRSLINTRVSLLNILTQ